MFNQSMDFVQESITRNRPKKRQRCTKNFLLIRKVVLSEMFLQCCEKPGITLVEIRTVWGLLDQSNILTLKKRCRLKGFVWTIFSERFWGSLLFAA